MLESIFPKLSKQFWEDLKNVAGEGRAKKLFDYSDDPVGFIEDVLGDMLAPDIVKVCKSVQENVWTIARSCNAPGKSHAAARIAIWFLLCHEKAQVYMASAPPIENLQRILFGEVMSVVNAHPELFEGYTKKTLELKRGPLDFLAGITIPASGTQAEKIARVSGKHRDALLFILDEADGIDEAVFQGIDGCLAGGEKVRVLALFNPRASMGRLYQMERDRQAHVVHLSAFNHPNVITGDVVIPGAVNRETVVRRINLWCRKLAEGERRDRSCFELPEFLVGAKAESDVKGVFFKPLEAGVYKPKNAQFSTVVLGEYPTQSTTQLISRSWIDNAFARWEDWVGKHGERPPSKTYGIMGVDVAAQGEDLNVTYIKWGPWIGKPTIWSGVDPDEGASRLIEIYRSTKIIRAHIDGTGIGASVAPKMMRKGCVAHSVMAAGKPMESIELGEFRILRDNLLWRLREWLRTDKYAMLPPDEILAEEMMTVQYDTDSGKIECSKTADMREILGRSPDRLMAMCMCFYEPRPLFESWDTRKGAKK